VDAVVSDLLSTKAGPVAEGQVPACHRKSLLTSFSFLALLAFSIFLLFPSYLLYISSSCMAFSILFLRSAPSFLLQRDDGRSTLPTKGFTISVLSRPVLSRPVLSCSCLVLSCPVRLDFDLSACPVPHCPALSSLFFLSCSVPPCPALFCLALSCSTLSCWSWFYFICLSALTCSCALLPGLAVLSIPPDGQTSPLPPPPY
jgi:hypothetical protein